MRYRRLLIIAVSILLGLTPAAAVGSKASGRGRGVAAGAADGLPTTQRRGRRPARKRGPARRAQSFSNDLGELRAQFNRDKGRVRLLMLLSPT